MTLEELVEEFARNVAAQTADRARRPAHNLASEVVRLLPILLG